MYNSSMYFYRLRWNFYYLNILNSAENGNARFSIRIAFEQNVLPFLEGENNGIEFPVAVIH